MSMAEELAWKRGSIDREFFLRLTMRRRCAPSTKVVSLVGLHMVDDCDVYHRTTTV